MTRVLGARIDGAHGGWGHHCDHLLLVQITIGHCGRSGYSCNNKPCELISKLFLYVPAMKESNNIEPTSGKLQTILQTHVLWEAAVDPLES